MNIKKKIKLGYEVGSGFEVMKTRGDRYFKIWDFMLFDLGLQRTELFVYAIIFGIYKKCADYFQGSREYLAKWTNSSVRTVNDALQSLVDKKLIKKHYRMVGNTRRTLYIINGDMLPDCEMFATQNHRRDVNARIRAEKLARGEEIEDDNGTYIIYDRDEDFFDDYDCHRYYADED